ncbi:hypothetical protein ACHAWF_012709, partial [Thalassiosira exigua]
MTRRVLPVVSLLAASAAAAAAGPALGPGVVAFAPPPPPPRAGRDRGCGRRGGGGGASSVPRSIAAISSSSSARRMAVEPPPGGIPATEEGTTVRSGASGEVVTEFSTPSPPSSSAAGGQPNARGGAGGMGTTGGRVGGAKVNEIDFTLAPTDVSLSRCYQMAEGGAANGSQAASEEEPSSARSLSLTRALNTASNRAVRRILLSRSWPSAEALNLSLRTVLMQQKRREEEAAEQRQRGEEEADKKKCPVPRPILNVIMNRRGGPIASEGEGGDSAKPSPRVTYSADRERLWIENQMAVFRESYGALPDYDQAEAYLDSVLCLATSGEESERVAEVMVEGGIYAKPYGRLLSVIQSVGAVLEEAPGQGEEGGVRRMRIAKKLIDQDICLSMLDKIALANEKKGKNGNAEKEKNPLAIPYDAAAQLAYDAEPENRSVPFKEFKGKYEAKMIAIVTDKKVQREIIEQSGSEVDAINEPDEEPKGAYEQGRQRRLKFWAKSRKSVQGEASTMVKTAEAIPSDDGEDAESGVTIKPDDLGGVLLSAEEPTVTRQLNALSNIVRRALIFGGDEELLVLAETLDADR